MSSSNPSKGPDANPGPLPGTGGVVQWTGTVTALSCAFFRVRLLSAP